MKLRRLIKQIEQLLYTQECVIVPTLGAFVRHYESSELDTARGLIYPSRCRLSFNAMLRESDGSLASQYAKSYLMSYKKAQALLEGDVAFLLSQLQQRGTILLGSVGRLTKREEGQLLFLPNPTPPFATQQYGQSPVAILPLLSSVEVGLSERKSKDVFYVPVRKSYLKVGAAALVMGALLLLFPPVNKMFQQEGVRHYQAGFFTPQEESSNATLEAVPFHGLPATSVDASGVEVVPESLSRQTEEVATDLQETALEPVPESAPEIAGVPIVEHTAGYYIIIASLKTKEQVAQYVTQRNPMGVFKSGGVLISSRGLHRLFAKYCSTLEDARRELKEVREGYGIADAWVYEQK